MNKIATSLLAGVALAGLAAAPASAQSAFTNIAGSPLPTFSFGPNFSTYSLSGAGATYNSTSGPSIFGTLSLTGSGLVAGSTYNYNTTMLNFVSNDNTTTFNETGPSNVSVYTDPTSGTTSYTFSALGAGFSGSGHTGDRLNLSYAAAPVPEASTVISFGALLALGGLAVLRRKSVVRAS